MKNQKVQPFLVKRKLIVLKIITFLLLTLLLLALLYHDNANYSETLFFIVFPCMCYLFSKGKSLNDWYKDVFYHLFNQYVAETKINNISYSQDSTLSQNEFNSTALSYQYSDEFESRGELITDSGLSIFNVFAYSHRATQRMNSFSGFLFRKKLAAPSERHIVIRPDTAEGSFSNFIGNNPNYLNLELYEVKIKGQKNFNDSYVCYSNSPEEVIISDSFINEFLSIESQLGVKPYLSIHNESSYIGIPSLNTFFSPKLVGEIINKTKLNELKLMIRKTSQVLDQL